MIAPSMNEPALVFDGHCGFCTACVLWASRRFRRPVELAPWQALSEQGRLGGYGLVEEETKRYAWWIEGARRWRGHRAAGRALLACRGAWPLLGALLLAPPPFSWPMALGYHLVSRNRGHLPGTRPACRRDRWPPEEAGGPHPTAR